MCLVKLLLLLLPLAEGFTGAAFHSAGLITAAVSHPLRGIAQPGAKSKLCLPGRSKLSPLLDTCLPGSSCSNLLRPSTSKTKSALVRSLSSGPTEVENPDFEAQLRNLDAQIARFEPQIDRVEAAIQAAEDKSNAATDTKERDYWRKEKEQLRKEKEQLRKEKEQLREEKSDLRKLALLGGTAGPVSAPAAPGKQAAGAAPEGGLRQVLRRSCPMGLECECAKMRNTHRTARLTWRNQRIISAILENNTVPVFLEREAQMERIVRLMLERQHRWRTDKQRNPVLCVPNSPGTGKSLFAAMLGQALEAGCLEGRSVAEVIPTLTAEYDAGDGNFTTVVSVFTYNGDMTARLNLGNQCAALFCRALYGSLGAKCSQLSAISFEGFARAARAQEIWGESDDIRGEYKALTGGVENENTNFVLLVDELAKIGSSEDPSHSAQQTMTELGAWLDASPKHHAVVTALHEQFTRAGVTGSNRNVEVATIVTDLSCVNGNAEALVQVFCQAFNVSTPTPPLRQNLQRTIALTSGHVRSLEKLQIGLSSNEDLRDEVLKGRRAEWQTLAQLGLKAWADDVGPVVLRHLSDPTQQDFVWKALKQVVLCHTVPTYEFQPLIESGMVQLAGSMSVSGPGKLTTARIDMKALALLFLLHAASTPGCHKLDPRVLQLATLLFDEPANSEVIEGLPTNFDQIKSVEAFANRKMSSTAERVVSWGVARILEEEAALRSKLLGTILDSTPTPKNVSIVQQLPDEDAAAFNRRLSALDAMEWAIHLPPDDYPAADLYAVRRVDERVAVQVKIDWNSSATPKAKQKRITQIRRGAHNVKAGDGPLHALTASRFVLVICSEAVSEADIGSLTAPNASGEQPVDVVLVGEDLARVLPRSLMRLTWMGIPSGEDDDTDADELDG